MMGSGGEWMPSEWELIEKAKNVLNYNPKYNLEQGVLEQIESYLNQ